MKEHEKTPMERKKPFVLFTQYVGKGHKALFVCPKCGKETWQHLNFLGQRKLVCSGLKITKE